MDTTNTSTATRIDELEARLAHQEHAVLQLGDELYRQQRQVAELEHKLRHLSQRLRELGDPGSAADPADETPPHY